MEGNTVHVCVCESVCMCLKDSVSVERQKDLVAQKYDQEQNTGQHQELCRGYP